MSVKLLTEHHLEFLSLTGGCTSSSESIHVKMPHIYVVITLLLVNIVQSFNFKGQELAARENLYVTRIC